jgi:16S rRNA (uracil1498-N3)-methyltransferase
MPQRFHILPEHWRADVLRLVHDEARHCAQVLRHQVGDEILVFNGAGDEADCRIAEVKKGEIKLECLSLRHLPAPPFRIILAAALIKNEAWEWLVEKATELGVSDIRPMIVEHCVVRLAPEDVHKKHEKWRRILLETCKQCQRAWMPRLHDPKPMREVLKSGAGFPACTESGDDAKKSKGLTLIAALTEKTTTIREAIRQHREQTGSIPRSTLILIGPEGDFTRAELQSALDHGAIPVTLGANVLRAETAATAAVAVLSEELRALQTVT